ncbi:hypothetical protein POX_b02163 [Penicillium oxalicum]|uniref:Uncharacterized protein n=1 Tax=Penicillium oxalicum (strain 114-2 / CGMCC 5302) TaxID=933388 RepID=S8B811_PENO1|nr:hypothetical protein POX_b02163 [Penicillium oxalicum]EPS30837.1 hypothetical protein PDE_05789 [Penicillium oxalicum 114-2]KAI2792127.1 hypothetical protein POX_b02163 [Penicillium oxalicum]
MSGFGRGFRKRNLVMASRFCEGAKILDETCGTTAPPPGTSSMGKTSLHEYFILG